MDGKIYNVFPVHIVVGIFYGPPADEILAVHAEETSACQFLQLVKSLVDDVRSSIETMEVGQVIVDIE